MRRAVAAVLAVLSLALLPEAGAADGGSCQVLWTDTSVHGYPSPGQEFCDIPAGPGTRTLTLEWDPAAVGDVRLQLVGGGVSSTLLSCRVYGLAAQCDPPRTPLPAVPAQESPVSRTVTFDREVSARLVVDGIGAVWLTDHGCRSPGLACHPPPPADVFVGGGVFRLTVA